jgi:hypothetical protein
MAQTAPPRAPDPAALLHLPDQPPEPHSPHLLGADLGRPFQAVDQRLSVAGHRLEGRPRVGNEDRLATPPHRLDPEVVVHPAVGQENRRRRPVPPELAASFLRRRPLHPPGVHPGETPAPRDRQAKGAKGEGEGGGGRHRLAHPQVTHVTVAGVKVTHAGLWPAVEVPARPGLDAGRTEDEAGSPRAGLGQFSQLLPVEGLVGPGQVVARNGEVIAHQCRPFARV